MPTLVKANISQAIGQALIDDIFLQKSKYYYGLGRSYEWESVNDTPPDVIDTEKYEYESRLDMLLAKKVDGSSIAFIIPRVNYARNVVYDIYDDDINLEDKNYYVMNTEFNVYKCLYNNGQPSTVEPTGTFEKPVRFSDGYVWQFIYYIPPALRNKFLTIDSIPVYNALTEKYYSRGSITNVLINSSGSGYTDGNTLILVEGDGYLQYNPQQIIDVSVIEHGSGYNTTPLANTQDPFQNSTPFSSNLQVIRGQYIRVQDSSGVRFYLAESSGVTGIVAPTNYYSTFTSGSVSFRHVGTKPVVEASIDSSAVGSIIIEEAGFGYPTVIFDVLNPSGRLPIATKDSPGTGANLLPVFVGGILSDVRVLNTGTGYTDTLATIDEPYPLAEDFATTTLVLFNSILRQVVGADTYYYRVTTEGTTGGTAPTHTSGSMVNGTAILTVIAKKAKISSVNGIVSNLSLRGDVEKVNVLNGGSGYSGTIDVSFVGGNPILPAVGSAVVSSGVITEVIISYPGYGYETAPDIIITGTTGSGFAGNTTLQYGYGYSQKVLVDITSPDDMLGVNAIGDTTLQKTNATIVPIIIDGAIRGIRVVDSGIGYTTATLTVVGDGDGASLIALFSDGDLGTLQAQSELFATPSSISSIKVLNGGSNLTSVNIQLVGDGTGAIIEPVLVGGVLQEILVIEGGTNYSFANISIVANNNATLPTTRVILSPIFGHGSNPIKEFNTRAIAIYGLIGQESNNGFPVDTDFRQITILKNPLEFSVNNNLNSLFEAPSGSTCFNISTTVLGKPISENDVLSLATTGAQFRVIQFTDNNILLQPLSFSSLNINDILTITISNTLYQFIVNAVSPPSLNKFTGELLFIDNLEKFTPSSEQTVSINTIINLT